MRKEQEAAERIRTVLEANVPDLKVGIASTPDHDLELRHRDGSRTTVEVKSLGAVRTEDLIGRLATGVLQLHRLPAGRDRAVIVSVPRASSVAARTAATFMAKHARDVGWGIVDPLGSVFLELPSKGVSVHTRAARSPGLGAEYGARPAALFSDLHAWLLKVLMLRDVPEPLWSGPRQPVSSAPDLQRVGAVARITAYRFVKTFERADFLRKSAAGLTIVRRGELIRAWLAQVLLTPVSEVPVRSIRGRGRRAADVFSQHSRLRWAIGGFEAARILGIQHASHGVIEIHLDGDVDEALRVWDLARCDRRDADFLLLRTAHVESAFRGCARLPEGHVVDALQVALDTSRHATRGNEQSEYILHEVLGWRDV